jgi:hypothetical protein
MIGTKSAPRWEVTVRQYSNGTFIRSFFVEVMANNEDLAKQAALDQINKWALGDFSVNVNPGDMNSGVQRPFIRYGIAGARNRIVSVRRIG